MLNQYTSFIPMTNGHMHNNEGDYQPGYLYPDS